jgi:Ca-activated chloride channel homolog
MERVVRLFLCAAVTLAAAALTSGQTLQDGTQAAAAGVFKSAAGLVTLNVTVQDARSRYVKGLVPDDFAVYEDGVKQHVRFFETTAVPVDLIVLIDRSTSMWDSRMAVRDAARGLIGMLRDGDRGAVLTFSKKVAVAQSLTNDRAALTAALDTGDTNGFTALYSALYVALREFGGSPAAAGAVRRPAIAVLSDGEDNASLMSFEEVIDAARQAGVTIYTIRLRTPEAATAAALSGETEQTSRADYQMRVLAQETGALSFFTAGAQLRAVYAAIGDEIASQYSIAYEPMTPLSSGGFRRVAVRVVGNPELRARTRTGYAARAQPRGE